MTSQVFTIHGTTSLAVGYDLVSSAIAQSSSALFLASDMWSGYIHGTTPDSNSFRIPKGCDLKIWESTVYGYPAVVAVVSSADSGATYSAVTAVMNYISGGQTTVKHTGRPIVVSSPDGNKLVKFVYNTGDTAKVLNNIWADFTVEVVESQSY